MRTTILATLAAAALIVGALAWPAPADAATAPTTRCVSKAEYRRVHLGMTPGQVRAKVGPGGRTVAEYADAYGNRSLTREYRACRPSPSYGYVLLQWSAEDGAPLALTYRDALL